MRQSRTRLYHMRGRVITEKPELADCSLASALDDVEAARLLEHDNETAEFLATEFSNTREDRGGWDGLEGGGFECRLRHS